jgi:hypothetical protein
MNRYRYTILQLVAAGRLTPADAEGLLEAWSLRRDEIWLLLICAAALVLPVRAPLHGLLVAVHAACSHPGWHVASPGRLLSQLQHITGGLL